MEKIINITIEKLPEGVYLATSSDVQGLVAQGRTVSETLEIARDVVRRLMEARSERSEEIDLLDVQEKLSIPLVVGV
jgi:predicted RNase H-like HicB family nuclease